MLTKKAKLFLSLTAATPLLFAAACTDNGIFDPRTDAAGTYQLTIFANASIPVTFAVQPGDDSELPNGGTWRVHDGTLVLRTDGSFTETNLITKTNTGGSSFESDFVSDGTYDINGSNIQFAAPAQNGFGARVFNGVVSEDRISYNEFDSQTGTQFLYEYRR
jgi:hypothetical protein